MTTSSHPLSREDSGAVPATEPLVVRADAAERLGLSFAFTPPPPTACEYCGAALYADGLVLPFLNPNRVAYWRAEPSDCGCPEGKILAESRHIEAARRDAAAEEERKREARRIYDNHLVAASGIRGRYLRCGLDSFVTRTDGMTTALNAVKRYVESFPDNRDGRGLFITGRPGTGKTHLAAAAALAFIRAQSVGAVFRRTVDMLAEIRATFDRDSDISEEDALARFRCAELLVMDDLGKEGGSAFTASMLFRILDDRYAELRPVIVTSNYCDEELVKRLSATGDSCTAAAIASRLYECCELVECGWGDWRQTG